MPIYVYEDTETGEEFEEFQQMKDEPLKVHPVTGNPVRRVLTCAKFRGTDAAFFAGRQTMADQFEGDTKYLNRFAREYKKQTGTTLPADGVYFTQLAQKKFDAKAVVTPAEGAAGLKRLIKRKQENDARKRSAPPVRLAEDIVQRTMNNYRLQGDKSDARELRQKVIETHGAKA
jgi:putative FmdB family regulatory protein